MKKAFVGFSSPIGYSYEVKAQKTRNDASSSPNPVLYGSMGLLTLYDQIWFACESLCPQSMRALPYVKFLDVEVPTINLATLGFDQAVQELVDATQGLSDAGLNDLFSTGFSGGMTQYLGGKFATDNHTHGLDFLGVNFGGNPGIRQLVADLWLLDRFKNLNLDLVLNPLTTRYGLDQGDQSGVARVNALGVADGVLTLGSLYDIAGPLGPYHPCVEELREDPLLIDFRLWMDEHQTSLHNYDIATVQADVDAKIKDFTRQTLRNSVQFENLKGVGVKLFKDELIGKVPGLSAISTVAEASRHNADVQQHRWKAFVAVGRDTINEARG